MQHPFELVYLGHADSPTEDTGGLRVGSVFLPTRGASFNVEGEWALSLGRSVQSAELRIPCGTVARVHAVVTWEQGGCRMIDLQSTNGTFINGVRLIPHQAQELKFGDRVTLGLGYQFELRRSGS